MKHKTHAVAASGGGKDEATDSMQTLKNRTIKMERRREEEANINNGVVGTLEEFGASNKSKGRETK